MKFRVIWLEPEQDKGAESVLPRSSIIDEGNIVVGQEVTCKWRKMRYRAVIDSIIGMFYLFLFFFGGGGGRGELP